MLKHGEILPAKWLVLVSVFAGSLITAFYGFWVRLIDTGPPLQFAIVLRGLVVSCIFVMTLTFGPAFLLRRELNPKQLLWSWAIFGAAFGFLAASIPGMPALLFGAEYGTASIKPMWLRLVLALVSALLFAKTSSEVIPRGYTKAP